MNTREFARDALLWVQGAVAVTAVAGGVALMLGALSPALSSVLSPPVEYLEGSPFASYLMPGLLLAGLLGGIHAIAFVFTLRRLPWASLVAGAAAFAMLIWIFVQMIFIPFSFLQAAYFAAGALEAGLVMMWLGVMRRAPLPDYPRTEAETARHA